MPNILSKLEFSKSLGVTPSCVSHWLATGKIDGAALVGRGHRARIDRDVAVAQLRERLDPVLALGSSGKALMGQRQSESEPTIESLIKEERRRQLELSNEKARDLAAIRSGKYIEAAAARREMGAVAGRALGIIETALPSMADAVAARYSISSRDVLSLLRATWREAREREAARLTREAGAMPEMDEDEIGQSAPPCA